MGNHIVSIRFFKIYMTRKIKSAWKMKADPIHKQNTNFSEIMSEQKIEQILKNDQIEQNRMTANDNCNDDYIDRDHKLAKKLQEEEDAMFVAMMTPRTERQCEEKCPNWAAKTKLKLLNEKKLVTKHNADVTASRNAEKMQGTFNSGDLEGLKIPSFAYNHYQNRMSRMKL